MQMILMIGIMFISLIGKPSAITSATAVSRVTRAQLLRAILEHSRYSHDVSKRNLERVDVTYRMDCCASETHLIHPRGGLARDGKLLEIYRDHRTVQKFYQTTCRPEILNKPCPLVDHKFQHVSRCVQKYSYVYAFVRDFNVSESFRLDYIKLKSGCSCELDFTLREDIMEYR
ncbi:uncharacterized protein LOC101864678 [Aplysia californica]|uniref:Uncharacterized protein LOC101864678 n=1 Tax=Aplysia californica TaxID=6500 RepID=A0ABM0ZWF2_APLCA|nr:uncharacterized protein LOC101864678 [Aplysia californica]